jgi:pimeloyl-ACP methyl ester carboxylesterase
VTRHRALAVVLQLVLVPALAVAEDRFFDADGVRIHFIEQGSGEAVVLLHGIGGSVQTWVTSGIVDNLAKDYRVIAFDARGHGRSGKPHDPKQYGREMSLDVVRLLDHLDIRRAHVVGFSMGAILTSQTLTLHPERFLTATLVAGAGRLAWGPEQARQAEQEAVEREQECVSRSLIDRLLPPGEPKPSEADIKARSAACFADANQDRFAIAALTRSRSDQVVSRAAAAAVAVPTLGVVGTADPARTGLEALRQIRPDIQLLMVEGATHSGQRGIVTRPELVAALREFIGRNRMSSQ